MRSRRGRAMVLLSSAALLWGVVVLAWADGPNDQSNGPNDQTNKECDESLFPASGQTTAYTADKNDGISGAVAVPDDGTIQAGKSLHYKDNGNGTITDKVTGLVWEKKNSLDATPDFSNLHDADNLYRWSGNGAQETIWDWLDDVNAEGGTGFAGHNDWRIPNVKELQSIVDYERCATTGGGACADSAAIDPVFGDTAASVYWSSSTLASSPTLAWVVNFFLGLVDFGGKSSSVFVRAVRRGCL